MRITYMGTPPFAVPALQALAAAGHHIVCVYTQPPRPAHRGQALTKCAVHLAAEALGIEVRTPARVRRDETEHHAFAALGADVAVVAAYGLILPPAMLNAPHLGCWNIHASLLPRWRGAAPIQAAIRAGDTHTGITVMKMDEGLDTGDMVLAEAIAIGGRETAPMVQDRLSTLGGRLIVRALAEQPPPVKQPASGVTYAAKLSRADSVMDFSQPAEMLDRQVRALTPWPGTAATLGGETIKVLEVLPVEGAGTPGAILDSHFTVATGHGAVRLIRVQRAGRPPVDGAAFLRGVAGWQDMRLS